MLTVPTDVPDLLVLEPKPATDARGFFLESWNRAAFEAAVGFDVGFVQDNHSQSRRGVLRGFHYQLEPHAQAKLVRVVRGSVFDVAVDLRRSSASFGRWAGVELSDSNHRQLWIPPGFGHAFMALSEVADVVYKVTAFYEPSAERTLAWNDPTIAVEWPLDGTSPLLSDKDANAPFLDAVEVFE